MFTTYFQHLLKLACAFTTLSAQEPSPQTATTPTAAPVTAPEEEIQAAKPVLITRQEISAQLQIFLNQKLFSAGMIDGKAGKFAVQALKRWQRANGLPETGVVDANVPLDSIHPVYTFHKVAKEEFKHLGRVPGKPSEQAKVKRLPYANYTEFLAERYHCSVEFLKKLNPTVNFSKIRTGDEIRVPNVEPFKIEDMPLPGMFPENPAFANRRLVIDRRDTILELYEGDKIIASIPIAVGSPRNPTPKGNWKVVGIAAMPTFRWDKGVLNYGKRTENFFMLPPGPNNPVGVGWIGLSKPGIGIHGTNNPYSIGQWASHGCMRTCNWDIARLSRMVTKGIPVEIR